VPNFLSGTALEFVRSVHMRRAMCEVRAWQVAFGACPTVGYLALVSICALNRGQNSNHRCASKIGWGSICR
jgi:hypothetical protein